MEIFKKLNEEGTTIIMVTHEPEIAHYASRVIHFRDGHILYDEKKRVDV
jgi:putative ABC transport system ATP-binding protein